MDDHKQQARKTADGRTVRPGMLLWTEDGQHVEKVESIDGDVVMSAYAATRWPKGMPVEQLYAETPDHFPPDDSGKGRRPVPLTPDA